MPAEAPPPPAREADKIADKLLDACAGGRFKSVQLTLSLVGRGNKPLVDVGVTDARGRTPLHLACAVQTRMEDKHSKEGVGAIVELVRFLICAGANVNRADLRGRTPLHVAVENASALARQGDDALAAKAENVVDMLLESGAAVDAAFDGGTTALALAARDGNKKLCELLIAHGARADGGRDDEQGDNGATVRRNPLAYPSLSSTAQPSAAVRPAGRIRLSLAPVLHRLGLNDLTGDSDAESSVERDRDKPAPARSPLQWAVCSARADLVELLLRAPGGDNTVSELFPTFDAERGRRPLHVAARLAHVQITKMLLHHNAQLDIPDDDGCTPYELLTNTQHPPHRQKDREETRQLLLDHSEGRVLAGGGQVRTISERIVFVLGVLLMYADTLSNGYLAIWVYNPATNPKGQAVAWIFTLTILAMLMPPVMYLLAQARQREKTPDEFRRCVVRTLFYVEPAYEAWQSLTHGDKTTGYTSVELLHCIFESIPSSVLQVYSLLRDWSDWDLSHAPEPLNPKPGVAILTSVAIALSGTLLASTNLAMENDDSAWREALVGHSTPLLGRYKGRILASLYFLGDGFYHIGALAIVAYALRWWGVIVFLLIFAVHFRLLCLSIESPSRAFVIAPLMIFVDFPLRSDKRIRSRAVAQETAKHCNEIVVRAAAASTIVLWAAVLMAAMLPGRVPTGGVGPEADKRVHEMPAFRTYHLPYRADAQYGVLYKGVERKPLDPLGKACCETLPDIRGYGMEKRMAIRNSYYPNKVAPACWKSGSSNKEWDMELRENRCSLRPKRSVPALEWNFCADPDIVSECSCGGGDAALTPGCSASWSMCSASVQLAGTIGELDAYTIWQAAEYRVLNGTCGGSGEASSFATALPVSRPLQDWARAMMAQGFITRCDEGSTSCRCGYRFGNGYRAAFVGAEVQAIRAHSELKRLIDRIVAEGGSRGDVLRLPLACRWRFTEEDSGGSIRDWFVLTLLVAYATKMLILYVLAMQATHKEATRLEEISELKRAGLRATTSGGSAQGSSGLVSAISRGMQGIIRRLSGAEPAGNDAGGVVSSELELAETVVEASPSTAELPPRGVDHRRRSHTVDNPIHGIAAMRSAV